MLHPSRSLHRYGACLIVALCAVTTACAEVVDVPLQNPSFEDGAADNGVPVGWSLYGGLSDLRKVQVIEEADEGAHALLISDDDPAQEVGIVQTVDAPGGVVYEASVMVRGVKEQSAAGSYIQMRFSPSGEFAQGSLIAQGDSDFSRVAVKGVAPEGNKTITIYLYTHRDPTPKVMVDSVKLVSGVEPPPPPPPAPVPPVYDRPKELYLTTDLVADGKAAVSIIVPASGAYDEPAGRIVQTIAQATGVEVPVATDDSPAAAVPIAGNLIVLGNRSTNLAIRKLYDLYYCLTDLKYPGPKGYEARTLHDPFGDGRNVVIIGGSDDEGVAAGVERFVERLGEAEKAAGNLSIGRLMDIRLGEGLVVPESIDKFETWEASGGYGSSGYFGWNRISKHMAAYYMTGEESHAREALRLAFPDQAAKDEIARTDGEMIENKDDPLAGPYHYNAHMMILYWDLIEDSPVFTDEERLQVANAFSRQLNHRKDEGVYGLTGPAPYISSRHGQWSAISRYCLGRYFAKSYPGPIWDQCVRGGVNAFGSLHEHAWVTGESDNLFWYPTGMAPIFTYLVLTGDRVPMRNGVIAGILRGQEILSSGRTPDWALRYAALDYLNKAAYLTGDGRWVAYRKRTGLDTSIFRLGQSFWPEDSLKPALPEDLVGKWSLHHLPLPEVGGRGTGFLPSESVYFGSFRSAADASGDYALIDAYNGASRNPYHTFALLELRIAGHTLITDDRGGAFRNQVLVRADGMVEPQVAMDAAIRQSDVIGSTASIVADVPKAAFCNWRRVLAQRVGQFMLVADDLTFRTDSQNIDVQTLWETPRGTWDAEAGSIVMPAAATEGLPAGWRQYRALQSPCTSKPGGPEDTVRLDSIGAFLLRAREAGSWLQMGFELPETFSGEVFCDLVNYTDRGTVRIYLDDEVAVSEYDHYAETASAQRVSLGQRRLAAGAHTLKVEALAAHGGADRMFIALGGVTLKPAGAPDSIADTVFTIQPSDPVDALREGTVTTLQWHGAATAGEHLRFFSLISRTPETSGACVRIADNAAALALPEPALAVSGGFNDTVCDLAVFQESSLWGIGLRSAGIDGLLVRCSEPVGLNWDFASGTVEVHADKPTRLALALAEGARLSLDGESVTLTDEDGLRAFDLPAGAHKLTGATPGGIAELKSQLASALQMGRENRERLVAAAKATPAPTAPALQAPLQAIVGGSVTDMVMVPSAAGPLVCTAVGSAVHVLDGSGKEVRVLKADGNIRVLHWWPEPRLLLAGCVDEKVIAFDEAGSRKWEFVSEMDPAVFRAAKQYWFKSAPGHEGIHGLSSGVFLEGQSQAFVGSACTLEIIDDNGQLVKRLPVFWGPGKLFQLIDRPDGSIDLLIAREPTDGEPVAMVNNRQLSGNPRGFYSVPSGHVRVSGWACMSRDHIFYVDMDGDGEKEVVSEINGTWNRVTVWNKAGGALYSANFGPGGAIPTRNVRDLVITDLEGDGKREIIVALSSGLVLALDNQCNKLWSVRMPSPPKVMLATAHAGGPAIYVGCEDGTVAVLDKTGGLVNLDKVSGAPTRISELDGAGGASLVVIATSKGEVKGFGQ